MLLFGWAFSRVVSSAYAEQVLSGVEHVETLAILLGIVIIFAVGFVVYELAKPTKLPSFVLAIFFGMAVHDSLSFLTLSPVSVTTLITVGAVLILFGGGIETPFSKFRDLIRPILSLAIVGTVLTAFLLSVAIVTIADFFGLMLPLPAAVLLGAALASTDPAAIIPCLRQMVFDKPRLKHIAISESAINDVVGAVLVGSLLTLLHREAIFTSVLDAYKILFSLDNALLLLEVMAVGTFVGVLGFALLNMWSTWKQRAATEDETDAALFIAVPLAVFTIASVAGGSGYLAVFVAGLLFSLKSHIRHVEHFFNSTIEGFMKPMIFIILGALVDPLELWALAGTGIAAGLLFMLVLRPLVVLITLLPFALTAQRFSIREMLFLSFIRETGVIPAVLLITIELAGVPGGDIIGAIGLWIILITLVVQPPLTPFIAKLLHVAHDPPLSPRRKHSGPVAVLCSRGYSFPERMQTVVEWAKLHRVDNIALLHCPEDRYTPEFVADVRKRAEEMFKVFNEKLTQEGHRAMNFEFLCGPGLLQENIESMIDAGDVSIIFVGSKMLDYRMEDVKRLDAPFYFM